MVVQEHDKVWQNKLLQDRIDALEDMLHEERMLSARNATQAIRFQKALGHIVKGSWNHGNVRPGLKVTEYAAEVLLAETGRKT